MKPKTTKKPKPSKPSQAALAKALNVTSRRVRQLAAESGMPTDSTAAALAWKVSKSGPENTAEAIRLARLDLLKEQARIAKSKADEQDKLLMPREQVAEEQARIGFALQGFLRRLEGEIPGLLLGLPLQRSKPLIRDYIRTLQTELNNSKNPDFWPDEITTNSTQKP